MIFIEKIKAERDAAKAAVQDEVNENIAAHRRAISALESELSAAVAAADREFEEALAAQRGFVARTSRVPLTKLLEQLISDPSRAKVGRLAQFLRELNQECLEASGSHLSPWFLLGCVCVATAKYGPVPGAALDAATKLVEFALRQDVISAHAYWTALEGQLGHFGAGGYEEIQKVEALLNGGADEAARVAIWDRIDREQRARNERNARAEWERLNESRKSGTPEPTRAPVDESLLSRLKQFAPMLF